MIDGLKPSQRKILYTAIKVATRSRIKTASLSGSVIQGAAYHHGDASLNAAINMMVQDFNNNLPLLRGHGSFGSRLVPESAAARYTFVELSDNFEKYFADNAILPESIDPEDPEPRHYLPIIPWVLVNGISGIAVGFATEIQPRNPELLAEICVAYLKGRNIDNISIPPHYKSFGGIIKKESDGRWWCYGTYSRKNTKLSITEVPLGFDREKYVSLLDKLIDAGKIVGYEDRCDKNGFNFLVTLRRSTQLTDKQIIATFKLAKALNENLTVINENGDLEVFDSVNEIVKRFVDFRLTYYYKRFDYYIRRDESKRDSIAEKIRFVNEVLDGTISLRDKRRSVLRSYLLKHKYTEVDTLMSMPIYSLTIDEIAKLKKHKKELDKAIKIWYNVNTIKEYIKDLS